MKKNQNIKEVKNLILNGMARDYFQRESLAKRFKDVAEEDLILISDLMKFQIF